MQKSSYHKKEKSANIYNKKDWDCELYVQCTQAIEKYLNKYELSFNLDRVLSLIIDLYLFSLTKNNKQIDEKSAEWLIEKLQISIPVKMKD